MKDGNPLVSIVMPVRNGSQTLTEAVDSLRRQTFLQWELIAINDGSTDDTSSILRGFTQKDSRIVVIDQAHQGVTRSLNNGVRLARAKYIARMDADDISHKDRLKIQHSFMEENPQVLVMGSWMQTFGAETKTIRYPLKHADIMCEMLFGSPFSHPTTFFRKVDAQNQPVFYDDAFYGVEDYALWVELSGRGKFANLSKTLLRYRTSPQQATRKLSMAETGASYNLIYQRQLAWLGIKPSSGELSLHNKMRSAQFESDESMLHDLDRYLVKLKRANESTQVYEREAFNRKLGQLWQSSCLLNGSLKRKSFEIYRDSELFKDVDQYSMNHLRIWRRKFQTQ